MRHEADRRVGELQQIVRLPVVARTLLERLVEHHVARDVGHRAEDVDRGVRAAREASEPWAKLAAVVPVFVAAVLFVASAAGFSASPLPPSSGS